jgi:aryl-alcohol dehydrogenase-like predicted oxidoreductase
LSRLTAFFGVRHARKIWPDHGQACQNLPLALSALHASARLFPTIEELGIGFVAYSPLGRGFLGGGLTEYTKFDPQKDIRGAWPRFTPEAIRANTRLLEVLNEFGKTRGMNSAQVAMAWMITKYPFVIPLFGTTKLSHLEEDARTADFALSMVERKEIEDKIEAIGVVGDRYDAANQSSVEY